VQIASDYDAYRLGQRAIFPVGEALLWAQTPGSMQVVEQGLRLLADRLPFHDERLDSLSIHNQPFTRHAATR